HDDDSREIAADDGARAQSARGAAGDVADDLDYHLQRGADGDREEEHAKEIARDEAADPGADDRRRTGDDRKHSKAGETDPLTACDRSCDAEPLRDVVHHES